MYVLFLILVLVFFWVLYRLNGLLSESLSDYFITFFLTFLACIIPTGFLLSSLNWINKPLAWGFVGVGLAYLFLLLLHRFSKNTFFSVSDGLSNAKQNVVDTFKKTNTFTKITFGILGLGLLVVSVINSVIFFFNYANEWDSMTGHLAKCAYYLQNGNMNRIDGTTWSIDYYPNALPSLQLFFYHIFGEIGFKVIHIWSYWIFPISTYGIAKQLTTNKLSAYFVFLITALLPVAVVQATTTETDIVLTAVMGVLVYFLFKFKNTSALLTGVLIILSACIWMSLKVTFLLIAPALVVVLLFTILLKKELYKNTLHYLVVLGVGLLVYVAPTGYIGNLKHAEKFSLGALSAPPEVMAWHGVEHFSAADKFINFKLNIARYTSEFLNFDGTRATEWGLKFNNEFRSFLNPLFSRMEVEGSHFTVVSYFAFEHPVRFYLERPYWGVISFGLVLPMLFFILFNIRKISKTPFGKASLILTAAAAIHFLSLCFSAPYDPIKARYFMNMGIWILPVLGLYYVAISSKLKDVYLIICSLFITTAAIATSLNKRIQPIFQERNIFNMSRIEQLTAARPEIYKAYKNFDELVPANAIVALGTRQENEDFEYPLFGKNLGRRLIPLKPFRKPVKPIPTESEYLFFSENVFQPLPTDIRLGGGNTPEHLPVSASVFYLRKLK